MKTRTKLMLSLFVASVAVAGCSILEGGGVKPEGGPGMRVVCDAPVCNITVNVNDCGISDPGSVYVKRRGQVQIIWRLSRGDHDFTANGITFRGGPFSAQGNPHPGKGVYTLHDNNTGPGGPYKYQIEVKKDGAPGNCRPLDPDIMNG